ncbi:unnamed protein product [Meganyctiphanes norvegica]|uniref:Uncharacterized protein n=1 Tax=Meganyctiphanes norvegica TaxID=48144 RepID=A0AAV2PHX7_MEGNR
MELLENVPQLYVKGRYQNMTGSYEIKTINGDLLMSGDCHYSNCGGWPEERFTIKHRDGSWAFELKGENTGCCSCSGGYLNTEVRSAYGDVIGFLKGGYSDILLTTSSNDFLGQIYGGLFSTNKKIKLAGDADFKGKLVYQHHITCQKFLVIFPNGCPSNIRVLIVAAALELVWKSIQDSSSG